MKSHFSSLTRNNLICLIVSQKPIFRNLLQTEMLLAKRQLLQGH